MRAVRDQIAQGVLQPGDRLPTVRKLAKQLALNQNTVGRAYKALCSEGLLVARSGLGTHVASEVFSASLVVSRADDLRALVSRAIGEGLARGYAPAELEAAFVGQLARWQSSTVAASSRRSHSKSSGRLVGMGSNDLCLDLLAAHFRQLYPNVRLYFDAVGSMAGLMAMARGEAQFAAVHLFDPAGQDYNMGYVRRLLPGRRLALVTLAHRSQGWIVAQGNPKRIRTVRDLVRRGVRFINRQAGSGTRVLLDDMLRRARVSPGRVKGYEREDGTHLAVAAAVAAGTADVGLGIQAAAQTFGLHFVPLRSERFELVLPIDEILLAQFDRVIQRPEFRSAVEALGGYDLSDAGQARIIEPQGVSRYDEGGKTI
jgi:molybdate-binding protein/DNA-binding transcriptional regulator YhcF (GntR family)